MPRLSGQFTEINLSTMYLKLYMESVLLILHHSYALHCVSKKYIATTGTYFFLYLNGEREAPSYAHEQQWILHCFYLSIVHGEDLVCFYLSTAHDEDAIWKCYPPVFTDE